MYHAEACERGSGVKCSTFFVFGRGRELSCGVGASLRRECRRRGRGARNAHVHYRPFTGGDMGLGKSFVCVTGGEAWEDVSCTPYFGVASAFRIVD